QQALALAERACFDAQWSEARATGRYENVCAAGITAAYALDEAGLLLIGSLAKPDESPVQAWLHAPDVSPVDVSARCIALPLEGDLTPVKAHLPHAGRNLSFVLHAPMATRGGARRMLRLVLPGVPDLWLRIDTPELGMRGPPLVRDILG